MKKAQLDVRKAQLDVRKAQLGRVGYVPDGHGKPGGETGLAVRGVPI